MYGILYGSIHEGFVLVTKDDGSLWDEDEGMDDLGVAMKALDDIGDGLTVMSISSQTLEDCTE